MTKGQNGKHEPNNTESIICPIHGKVLVCPSCAAAERGRKGGQALTERKAKTAKQNAAKGRKALAKKVHKN